MPSNARYLVARRAVALMLMLWLGSASHVFAAEADGVGGQLGPDVVTGTIYAGSSATNEVLFTFRRTAARQGSTVRVEREFTRPNGTISAREHVRYEDGKLAAYELEELDSGASGSVVIQSSPDNPPAEQIVFTYAAGRDSVKKTRTEPLQKDILINDTIAPFIAAHWDNLMKGAAVKFRFAVVARKETIGFKFLKQSETTWRGKPAVVIRMEPTSLFIAPLVSPLFFTVEKSDQHRILQYIGRTTPRIKQGTQWQDLDALTVFDWK